MSVLNATGLFTLGCLIICHVKFTSIKKGGAGGGATTHQVQIFGPKNILLCKIPCDSGVHYSFLVYSTGALGQGGITTRLASSFLLSKEPRGFALAAHVPAGPWDGELRTESRRQERNGNPPKLQGQRRRDAGGCTWAGSHGTAPSQPWIPANRNQWAKTIGFNKAIKLWQCCLRQINSLVAVPSTAPKTQYPPDSGSGWHDSH